MNIKKNLKRITFLRKWVKRIKIKREFSRDAKDFCKHYMENETEICHLEYNMLLLVHSLEKGMCNKDLRPFGQQKCRELLHLIKKFPLKDPTNTPYMMSISILSKWKNIFEQNNWEKGVIYQEVAAYLSQENLEKNSLDVGAFIYTKDMAETFKNLNYSDAIQTRHSIREFAHRRLEMEDIIYCAKAAIYTPSACNRQMCKIYMINNEHSKSILDNTIMGLGGFDKEWINYFVITYDIGAFSFYGERYQGFFNAGLLAMNFANAMHFKGIGSCFLQWANTGKEDVEVRLSLGIPNHEKIVVILAAGYYPEECIVPKSHRKEIGEFFKIIDSAI